VQEAKFTLLMSQSHQGEKKKKKSILENSGSQGSPAGMSAVGKIHQVVCVD